MKPEQTSHKEAQKITKKRPGEFTADFSDQADIL